MILYHFTQLYLLKNGGTILTDGLKPAVKSQGLELPPFDVVWLTTNVEPTFACDDDANEINPFDCRITVVIPSSDRRLVNWGKWTRKHAPEVIEQLRDSERWHTRYRIFIDEFYCYFGVVLPSRFRDIHKIEFEEEPVRGERGATA